MKTYTKTIDTQAAAQLFAELAEIPGVIALTHLDPEGRIVTIDDDGVALTEDGEETIVAVTAGSMRITSDRPDEDGPLVLTIPIDIARKAVEAVIAAHQDTPLEAPTSRLDRARATLAAIDRTKITGEAAKLVTVLDELVSD